MKHNLPKMHHQDATTRFGQRFGFYQIETKCLKTPGRIATKIPWHEVGIHESFWECKLNHAIWQRIPQIQRNHHPISIISQPLKKNIQKQKCHHFPTKKKTLKKKLPPSYYTHLVLIGISASRLLVVFLQPLWRPVERQGLSSMTSKSIQHCWSCPLLAHAAMVAVPLEVLGRERFFDGKLAWYLEIFV